MKDLLKIRKYNIYGEYQYEDRDEEMLRAYDAGEIQLTSDNDNDCSATPLNYGYDNMSHFNVRAFS